MNSNIKFFPKFVGPFFKSGKLSLGFDFRFVLFVKFFNIYSIVISRFTGASSANKKFITDVSK